MNRALGREKAESVLARITPPEAACELELLDWLDASEIAAMIEKEHPQIAAVLIANLDPAVGGQVLELLPDAVQPDILHRIARLGPITPEAVETLKTVLANRAGTGGGSSAGVTLGGTREAAKILSGRAQGDRAARHAQAVQDRQATSPRRSRRRCSSSTICWRWTTRISAR